MGVFALLSTTTNKKKKHDKTIVLAKSKLNGIETLVSQALIDMETSHEGQIKECEWKKENFRLNSVNSKT